MKKLLCLLLIAGCSNVEHHRHQDVVESLSLPQSAAQSVDAIDAFGTFDAFYFSDIFLNALDSSGDASGIDIDVEQQTQKLRNEY
jgi:hypothetical protein